MFIYEREMKMAFEIYPSIFIVNISQLDFLIETFSVSNWLYLEFINLRVCFDVVCVMFRLERGRK